MPDDKKEPTKGKIVYPEPTEDERPLYSNAVNINHTPWDFSLHFSYVVAPIAPPTEVTAEIEIKARRVAVVTIPVTLVKGLMRALQTNVQRYERSYGKIEAPKEEAEK